MESLSLENFYFHSKAEIEILVNQVRYIRPVACFLGHYWKPLQFKENPSLKLFAPFLYCVGMVTFAVSLGFRIARCVARLFAVFYEVFRSAIWHKNNLDYRVQLLKTTSIKILVALCGILCPPIGYELEEKVNKKIMPEEERILYFIKFNYE